MSRSPSNSRTDSAEIEEQLKQVKYISDTRAQYFINEGYTSPEDVAEASAAELVDEVYNVGPKTAERVLESARDLVDDGGEVTDDELEEARDAHRYERSSSDSDEERDVEQSGVPLEAVEGLHGSTLDLSNDTEEEVDTESESEAETSEMPEVTAEQFEIRLMMRHDGEEFWYRDPETGALIQPYEAPGFENWCDERGHDPETFRVRTGGEDE